MTLQSIRYNRAPTDMRSGVPTKGDSDSPTRQGKEEGKIDLSTADAQRLVADELRPLISTRVARVDPLPKLLDKIASVEIRDLQVDGGPFVPELQVELAKSLNQAYSGPAEKIFIELADHPQGIHPEALDLIASLARDGVRPARKLATQLTSLERPIPELFLGGVGGKIFLAMTDRRELYDNVDSQPWIEKNADFLSRRLGFILSQRRMRDGQECATAFGETLSFLAADLTRGHGLRCWLAAAIIKKHDLIGILDLALKRTLDTPFARVKRLLLWGTDPLRRVSILAGDVGRGVLAKELSDCFSICGPHPKADR